MRYLTVYALISASKKGEYLKTGKLSGVRSIDPRIGAYEDGILNGHLKFTDAKELYRLLKGLGYKVSVIGVQLPAACVLGGRPCGYTGDRAEDVQLAGLQSGYGNYLDYTVGGDGKKVEYVAVSDIHCISGIFDPFKHQCGTAPPAAIEVPVQAPPAPKAQAPKAPATGAVGGMAPAGEMAGAGNEWMYRLLCLMAGYLLGTAASGIADRHPLICCLTVLAVLAASLLWLLYWLYGRRQ